MLKQVIVSQPQKSWPKCHHPSLHKRTWKRVSGVWRYLEHQQGSLRRREWGAVRSRWEMVEARSKGW